MEENFNHEQSLTLINEMILRAQNNVRKGKTHSIIFMGYVVVAAAVTNYVLIHTLSNPYQSFLIWLVIILALPVAHFITRRDNREKLLKTHIDKINTMVWNGFGISAFVFLAVIFTVAFRIDIHRILILCTPVISTMIGMVQFVLACIYRRKMWYWIAALFWGGAVTCVFLNADMHLIIFAVCVLLGFVAPGHIVIYQTKKSHV